MTARDLQRQLIERLDQQPVESWSPYLLRFVLNAMDLEARGELRELLHVPTGGRPIMTIIPDTTGLDIPR